MLPRPSKQQPATTASLEWLDSLQGSGIRPGLGRMRVLLRELGRPHIAVPSIIIAGTNGKGSTAAMLASIFWTSNYWTGLYTSPHLVDLRERWMIGGELIDPQLLDESIDALRAAADRAGITPTYFEALTLIAFIAFARARCDVAVLEVGMGGRLDATNVVRPIAALITPIGLDHTEFLGNTIRKVAVEKAGVIHRDAIVLTTNDEPAVLDVLRRRAAKFGNRFVEVREEHDAPLAGSFQRRNAALAVRAARELMPRFPAITEETIERGIARTRWRGRLEHLRIGGKDVWIDGAHNAHGAAAIRRFIDERLPRPRLLVFGMMSDKNIDAAAATLFPLFDRIIATEPYPPRSAPAESLAERARELGIAAGAEPSPAEAVRRALDAPERSLLVAGSLYLAGAAIELLDALRERSEGEEE